MLLCKVGSNWDPTKVSPDQLLRMAYLLQLTVLLEPETQVKGIVLIVDLNGFGFKQLRCFSLAFIKKSMQFVQEALLLRLKKIHIVNNPRLFKLVWQISKPLMQEKLCERVIYISLDGT